MGSDLRHFCHEFWPKLEKEWPVTDSLIVLTHSVSISLNICHVLNTGIQQGIGNKLVEKIRNGSLGVG